MTSYAKDWRASEMTLRDYFAAQAMGGMLASTANWPLQSLEAVANLAYQLADKMMDERARKDGAP